MKRVYSAGTLLEAQLVADTLSGIGILNHVLNQHAVGGMGELPYSQVLPEIWIDDNAHEARAYGLLTNNMINFYLTECNSSSRHGSCHAQF